MAESLAVSETLALSYGRNAEVEGDNGRPAVIAVAALGVSEGLKLEEMLVYFLTLELRLTSAPYKELFVLQQARVVLYIRLMVLRSHCGNVPLPH